MATAKKSFMMIMVLEKAEKTIIDMGIIVTVHIVFFMKLLSIALAMIIGVGSVYSLEDEEGAIGLIKDFLAVLVVFELDTMATPFVLQMVDFVYGLTSEIDSRESAEEADDATVSLERVLEDYVCEYPAYASEGKKIKTSGQETRMYAGALSAFASFIFIIGIGNLAGQFNACNSDDLFGRWGEVYVETFFPAICTNATKYCEENLEVGWVPWGDTNCAIESVEEAADYFVQLNDTAAT
mmetsp:Transcript_34170/g.107720  ORF Transcript_34170/g.107720 Transcript_34170/m.107720 type:complete len:239 (-) Transcript_34170:90-806(-)